MAFKLTKTDEQALEKLHKEADELKDKLAVEADAANEKIQEAVEHLNGFVRAYNEKVSEIREKIGEIASNFRGEFDDKSESWQEGDRGQEVDSFIQEWESADATEVDEVEIDPISLEIEDLPSTETLPTEAG